MDALWSFIGFVITLLFYIWFGRTLNSINASVRYLAEAAFAASERERIRTQSPLAGIVLTEAASSIDNPSKL